MKAANTVAKAEKTGEYYRELSLSYAAGTPPTPQKSKKERKRKAVSAGQPGVERPRGARCMFYLHPADRARLDDLLKWLSQQGQPATLSKVVKACIALAKPSDELLAAFESGLEQDLRRKPSTL